MTVGTITGTVTQSVVLGRGNYGTTLTIALAGAIEPSAAGKAALSAPFGVGKLQITNHGTVLGSAGPLSDSPAGGAGGAGLLLDSYGSIVNTGIIGGGAGGGLAGGNGGNGGYGIDLLAVATVFNSGTITGGGVAVSALGDGGAGGNGVDLQDGGTVENQGLIAGGAGGYGYGYPGDGGAGVLFAVTGTLSNIGTILGGAGGESNDGPGGGAAGVQFSGTGVLHNGGMIAGGSNGGDGVYFGGVGFAGNTGTIAGGTGGYGVDMQDGGTFVNGGLVTGGTGIEFYGHFSEIYGPGMAALKVSGNARLGNTGTLIGGAGVDPFDPETGAAAAVLLESSGSQTLWNRGLIQGGAGASSTYYGGAGAAGAILYGESLFNRGTITGGLGGAADHGTAAGAGGAGVMLDGGVLQNFALIEGGSGGTPASGSVAGGVGVYLNAGILEAIFGTIAGGAPGVGAGTPGGYADAVQFGTSVAATLLVAPGAVFEGAIVASPEVNDVLELGGHAEGALSGFGAAGGISGFSGIVEESGALWSLTGTLKAATTVLMGSQSVLTLSGVQSGNLYFGAGGDERLKLATPAGFSDLLHGFGTGDSVVLEGVDADVFRFRGGRLELLDSSGGTLASLAFAGDLTEQNFGLKQAVGVTEVYYQSSSAALGWDWHWGVSI